ncbi:MAG: mechanosensitive ion channel family protein [Halanaerobiales bacterium]
MNWQEKLIELSFEYGGRLLGAILVFIFGKWVIKLILKYINRWSKNNLDPTLHSFVKSIAKTILYILLFITAASTMGIQMTSFVAIFGAAGLAIGLALQGSLANFAGGVLILTFRPFNINDFIEVNGNKGKVKSIQILYTTLLTRDNKNIIIPNGTLANSDIINYSIEDTRRVDLQFGVGYDDNILQVKEILQDIVDNHELILKEPAPIIRVGEHADSSVNFNTMVWTESENYWTVYYDLMEEVKLNFDEEGINIPYPQMDVHLEQ